MAPQIFGVWGLDITFTTAAQHGLSPLLQVRLCIHGRTWSGDINLFHEISSLSGLVFHCHQLEQVVVAESSPWLPHSSENDCSTSPQAAAEENITSEAQAVQQSSDPDLQKESLDSATNHVDSLKQDSGTLARNVTERFLNGSELQVPYKISSETLHLFEFLEKLKVPFETEIYKPKEERLQRDKNIFYCKNLFLKDRKGQFYLVICHEELNIDLKQLRKSLNANRNFNFGTAQEMNVTLGTEPGGVSPLALMNPNSASVKMVIHKSLTKDDAWLMFHPLDSRLAIKMSLASLLRFLKTCQHSVTFVNGCC